MISIKKRVAVASYGVSIAWNCDSGACPSTLSTVEALNLGRSNKQKPEHTEEEHWKMFAAMCQIAKQKCSEEINSAAGQAQQREEKKKEQEAGEAEKEAMCVPCGHRVTREFMWNGISPNCPVCGDRFDDITKYRGA